MGVRHTVFRKSSILPHKPAKSVGEYSPTYSPSVKMYIKCPLPFIVGGGVGEGERTKAARKPTHQAAKSQPTSPPNRQELLAALPVIARIGRLKADFGASGVSRVVSWVISRIGD